VEKLGPFVRAAAPACAVLLIFVACLATLAGYSFRPRLGMAQMGSGFTLESYAAFFRDPFNLAYLWRSLWIATYTTAVVLVLGYVVAYHMTVCGPRMRLIITIILLVQFFTSYVIRTYAIVLALGRYGIVNNGLIALGVISVPAKLLFTEFAVAAGLVLVAVPFMVFPVYGSIAGISPNLRAAAGSLGATPAAVFREIVLPLSLPGVAAGVVIVYLFNLTAFITPSLLGGGHVDMIANLIFDRAMNTQDYPFASAAAMVSLLLTLIIVYLLQSGFRRTIRGAER